MWNDLSFGASVSCCRWHCLETCPAKENKAVHALPGKGAQVKVIFMKHPMSPPFGNYRLSLLLRIMAMDFHTYV